MRIPPPSEEARTEISVVPLVNVVFLLLIFFMLVGQIASPEPLDVRPPKSVSGKQGSGESVTVLLTREGRIALERVVVPAAGLTERAAAVLAKRPDAVFQLKADARVEAVRMISVMESLRAAGVERLTLLTEQERFRR